MKRSIVLLLITLFTTTTSFSQIILNTVEKDTTVSITPEQLKIANFIFVEHDALIRSNALLYKQLNNFENYNNILKEENNLQLEKIRVYEEVTNSQNIEIANLNSEIKKKSNTIRSLEIGGITISVSLLLWLLLK